jgi:hypothetical protein
MNSATYQKILSALFLAFFVVALGYSVYASVFPKDEGVKKAHILCVAGAKKSTIIVQFMLQAADIRRQQAAAEHSKIVALNDIAVAQKYEQDAVRYDRLTIKDC